jgi:hypothetical protein
LVVEVFEPRMIPNRTSARGPHASKRPRRTDSALARRSETRQKAREQADPPHTGIPPEKSARIPRFSLKTAKKVFL